MSSVIYIQAGVILSFDHAMSYTALDVPCDTILCHGL